MVSEEKNISMADLMAADIGGNATIILTADKCGSPRLFTVLGVEGVKTEWGTRIEFLVSDNVDEYKLSSWNVMMKTKLNVGELIDKKIRVVQSTKNPKKVEVSLA